MYYCPISLQLNLYLILISAAQNKNFGPNRLASDEGPPPYDGRDSKAVNGYGKSKSNYFFSFIFVFFN